MVLPPPVWRYIVHIVHTSSSMSSDDNQLSNRANNEQIHFKLNAHWSHTSIIIVMVVVMMMMIIYFWGHWLYTQSCICAWNLLNDCNYKLVPLIIKWPVLLHFLCFSSMIFPTIDKWSLTAPVLFWPIDCQSSCS